jgi:asparagine synthase (glutamine-hydrolysing)
MCGIFGRFARNGALGNLEELCRATNLLSHRGPDDGAFWADEAFFLGHRRLSIIDLSTGGQPMATPDARYVIVFNGEIYNYKELREELTAEGSRFGTTSDTEVILRGYERWGTDLPKHLIGMFAFAIADRLDRSLFVARDRFGEKPLLLKETSESVDFASELNPLVQLPGTTRRIELEALAEYLSLNYVPGDRTLVQGVRRLPPGAWRLYRRADAVGEFYWHPPRESGGRAPTLSQATDELGERLDRSVRIALRADVPITLFLSGGIDSSAVAESLLSGLRRVGLQRIAERRARRQEARPRASARRAERRQPCGFLPVGGARGRPTGRLIGPTGLYARSRGGQRLQGCYQRRRR